MEEISQTEKSNSGNGREYPGSFLKVLGERNCGTNYLEQLWEKNFKASILSGNPNRRVPLKRYELSHDIYFALTERSNLGWKHAMAPSADLIKRHKGFKKLGIVALVKNPYSFLLSLYKRPYQYIGKKPSTLAEFLTTPWKTTKRERWWEPTFHNPIELWNEKNHSYVSIEKQLPQHVMVLRYEDLIGDPIESLRKMSNKFGLNGNGLENVTGSTKNDSGKDFDTYRDYYLQEKWREDLSSKAIEVINKNLDKALMDELGYKFIDS